ncbi:MAG: hypothetical protein IJS78_02420, partial [Clostridia bacterium]|nr:hypothetical protein [Clostridia bacterium]
LKASEPLNGSFPPRTTLFFSAGFFSLEKKRVQKVNTIKKARRLFFLISPIKEKSARKGETNPL